MVTFERATETSLSRKIPAPAPAEFPLNVELRITMLPAKFASPTLSPPPCTAAVLLAIEDSVIRASLSASIPPPSPTGLLMPMPPKLALLPVITLWFIVSLPRIAAMPPPFRAWHPLTVTPSSEGPQRSGSHHRHHFQCYQPTAHCAPSGIAGTASQLGARQTPGRLRCQRCCLPQ